MLIHDFNYELTSYYFESSPLMMFAERRLGADFSSLSSQVRSSCDCNAFVRSENQREKVISDEVLR